MFPSFFSRPILVNYSLKDKERDAYILLTKYKDEKKHDPNQIKYNKKIIFGTVNVFFRIMS